VTEPARLSDTVSARVVAVVADSLAALDVQELPPTLRRVAGFAPARRAKLAAAQISAALESDEQFRERVAREVDSSAALSPDDAVDAAARAYLLREDGWEERLAAAEREVRSARASSEVRALEQANAQLRARVAQLEEELRGVRDRQRTRVTTLKEEVADLRHRLGASRSRTKDAERALADRERAIADLQASAERDVAALDAEVRRLRGRVTDVEGSAAENRRAERAARVEESVRARLLVETLVKAAQGLQRELGLGTVDRLPADTVAALEAEHGVPMPGSQRSLSVDDPALLDQLLRLPRAHLVVDGYNVTKTGWPDLALDRQRDRLLGVLAPLVARTGAETTVVFDAAESASRPLVAPPRGLRVLFSPRGVIADDVIRDLVAAEPRGRAVVVASSDQEVVRDVVALGFRAVDAMALVRLVTR
jgi:predicted RNA-binding protein with PIN domain